MSLLGRSILASFVVALAVAAPPAPVYEPDLESATGVRFEGDRWVLEGPAARLELLPVDGAARARFLTKTAGITTDPFAASPASPSRYLTWVLVVENRSSGNVFFQPQAARLVASDGRWFLPLDLPAIQEAYASLDREPPEQALRLADAIFDGEQTIPPGKAKAGLLAYRTTRLESKRFHLEIAVTNLRGEATEAIVPYRKARKK